MKTAQGEVPSRLIRVADGTPEIDVEKRTVRAQIATRRLARDGGILLPEGINVRFYKDNPVVQAMHGAGLDSHAPVIGRSLSLWVNASGVESVTRFADTDLGREYAYLYGCNPQKEVFMRAWSFGWRSLSIDWMMKEEAAALLGKDWDEDAYQGSPYERVWVCPKSEMLEYSAVAVGADRAALSRAYSSGVGEAGRLVSEMDLAATRAALDALKTDFGNLKEEHARKLAQLEDGILALRRDGAAAAARGDTAELIDGLRALREALRR